MAKGSKPSAGPDVLPAHQRAKMAANFSSDPDRAYGLAMSAEMAGSSTKERLRTGLIGILMALALLFGGVWLADLLL